MSFLALLFMQALILMYSIGACRVLSFKRERYGNFFAEKIIVSLDYLHKKRKIHTEMNDRRTNDKEKACIGDY